MKVPMLLKNKYVLYVLLFVGIMNILGYVALEQYNALALFVVLGLLSSYFSKNMSVNLLVPIIGTGLMVVNDMADGSEVIVKRFKRLVMEVLR